MMTKFGGGRGRQKLNEKQQKALDYLAQTNLAYRTARLTIQAKLKQQLEEELVRYALAQDEAVYEAAELGIPKTRIAQDGLNITGTNAVYEAINRHKELIGLNDVDLAEKPVEPCVWSELIKLPNGAMYAYLTVADAPHHTRAKLGDFEFDGDGWLFIWGYATGWLPLMSDQPPAEIEAWGLANPPEGVPPR